MAKAKRKRTATPHKIEKQEMEGLGVSFEEAMQVLSKPPVIVKQSTKK
jgi:hypothetical protein